MAERHLIFSIGDHRFGLRLGSVVRVVRMPAITPLLGAPVVVCGIVNVGGVIVPVMDLRRRFGLTPREARIEDHLVLAHTRQRTVALSIDRVIGIEEFQDSDLTRADTLAPGLRYIERVARLAGALVLIHDLDTFLSRAEVTALEAALAVATPS